MLYYKNISSTEVKDFSHINHKLNTHTSHMGLLSSVARSSNQSTTTLLFKPLNNSGYIPTQPHTE